MIDEVLLADLGLRLPDEDLPFLEFVAPGGAAPDRLLHFGQRLLVELAFQLLPRRAVGFREVPVHQLLNGGVLCREEKKDEDWDQPVHVFLI